VSSTAVVTLVDVWKIIDARSWLYIVNPIRADEVAAIHFAAGVPVSPYYLHFSRFLGSPFAKSATACQPKVE
jgi:hypothetical protein